MRKESNLDYALTLAKQAEKLAKQQKDLLLLIDAKIAIIGGLITNSNFEKIESQFKELENLLENKFNSEDEKLSRLVTYYKINGMYNSLIGKQNIAIEKTSQCIKIEEKLGKINDMLLSRLNLSAYYANLGDFTKSEEILFNSLKIIKEKNLSDDDMVSSIFGNLGSLYFTQGELDKSIEYLNKSNESIRSTSSQKTMNLSNLGLVWLSKGDIDQALTYLKTALTDFHESGDVNKELLTLTFIINAYIVKNDLHSAQENFNKINAIYEKSPENEVFKVFHTFSKGLLLAESDRLHDKIEAQKIFHDIISKEEIFDDITTPALMKYLELLLEELKVTGSESVLQEIEESNKKLMRIAKSQQSHSLIAESLLFEAELSVIRFDFSHARQVLTQAQISAEEKGLKLLAQKISREHDNLLTRIDQFETVKEETSLKDRLEMANLEDLIRAMVNKSVDTTEESSEKGLIFLIVNSVGLSAYSRTLASNRDIEDQMVAGLLTAINTFSQETFKTKDKIERIKYGENTILLRPFQELSLCYVFQGSSYQAGQKLNKILSKLKTQKEVMNELISYRSSLTQQTKQRLEKIFDETFV